MPVIPNLLERLVLFRLNKAPGPMLDLLGGAAERSVGTATELGLFDALADRRLSAVDLASEIDADEHGVSVLLGFLEALGYVTERDGRYANTRMTKKWLLAESEKSMAAWLTFWNDLVFEFWDEHIETTIREGNPPLTIYEWFDEEPERWRIAQEGFLAIARLTVDEVVGKVTLPDSARRVLDVGGGHGLYSIELCRRNPELSATVFDSPRALDVAREQIDAAGMGDYVTVQAGDYLTDDLGEGYDVALLFNVVHAHTPEENIELLRRVADALDESGQVVVLDQFEGSAPTPVGEAALGFLGVTYLVTLGANVYPSEAVTEWLRAAGFTTARRRKLRAVPGVSVVLARK